MNYTKLSYLPLLTDPSPTAFEAAPCKPFRNVLDRVIRSRLACACYHHRDDINDASNGSEDDDEHLVCQQVRRF
jgi:hypothetical protein